MKIGIPPTSIVRLGSKSNHATGQLLLRNQQRPTKLTRSQWEEIESLKCITEDYAYDIERAFSRYKSTTVQDEDLLTHLEFEEPIFYRAFKVPLADDGMTQVGRGGRAVGQYYLLKQWVRGWDAGIFKEERCVLEASQIWGMAPAMRETHVAKWKELILKDQVMDFYDAAKFYNERQSELEEAFGNKATAIIGSKRVIGCTTTAAAKYTKELQEASPDVLLVEEAGEILESHVLTALGATTNQLILIGDHK